MNNDKEEYIPPEYGSLLYLHTMLGDVEIVKCICHIWNKLNKGDTLRIKQDDGISTITLTGLCSNLSNALFICKYMTTYGVLVKHEKTIITETWEV